MRQRRAAERASAVRATTRSRGATTRTTERRSWSTPRTATSSAIPKDESARSVASRRRARGTGIAIDAGNLVSDISAGSANESGNAAATGHRRRRVDTARRIRGCDALWRRWSSRGMQCAPGVAARSCRGSRGISAMTTSIVRGIAVPSIAVVIVRRQAARFAAIRGGGDACRAKSGHRPWPMR